MVMGNCMRDERRCGKFWTRFGAEMNGFLSVAMRWIFHTIKTLSGRCYAVAQTATEMYFKMGFET